MAEHPETLETLAFALQLLRKIPRAPSYINARDLTQSLEGEGIQRTKRSVERMLKKLTQENFIECDDTTRPYRFSHFQGSTGFWLADMSYNDALLIHLAERQLKYLLPPTLTTSMHPFFKQAHEKLSNPNDSKAGKWLEKVNFVSPSQPLLSPEIRPGIFETISRCLFNDHKIDIHYRNRHGKKRSFIVNPIALVQCGAVLYLVVTFDDADEPVQLALHRMLNAESLSLQSTRPQNFRLQQYIDDAKFSFGEGERVRLTFDIVRGAGFHLTESRLSEDQIVEEFDDKYRISATVVDSLQLRSWLLSFGDEILKWEMKQLSNTSGRN